MAIQALTDKRLADSLLADWATYYAAVAHAKAGRPAEAVRLLEPIVADPPAGAIAELGARLFAEAAEALSHREELVARTTGDRTHRMLAAERCHADGAG